MQHSNVNKSSTDKISKKFYVWKIIIFFYILFIISLGVTIYIFENLSNKITEEFNVQTIKSVGVLNSLTEIQKNIFIIENATLKHIYVTDDLQMSRELAVITSLNQNLANLKKYEKHISTAQEQSIFNKILLKRDEIIKSRQKIILLSSQNKDQEAIIQYNIHHFKNFNEISQLIATLIDLQIEKANFSSYTSTKSIYQSTSIIKFYIGFSILIILIIGYLIYDTIKKMANSNKRLNYQKNLSETLIDSGPDAIIGINENQEIIIYNKQAEKIYGFKRNEVLNENYQFLIDLNVNNENTIGKNKNGEEFPIEINKSEIVSDGKILTLFSIRDVSEAIRINQILKDKENKFKNVFEGSHNAIVLSNSTNYIDCNKQALEMFKISSVEEFLKYKPLDFSPLFQPNGEQSELVFKEILKKVLEFGFHRYEWLVKRPDGSLLYTEILLSSYEYQGRKVFQANLTDITELKKTENFLVEINKAVSVKTGKNYFSELTLFIIEQLKVKYAFVGNYIPGNNIIETISFRDNNQELDNFIYDLKNTPCQITIESETFCCFPDKVQSFFPMDIDLEKLNVESYLGINLVHKNKIEGIIVLMDDKPMEDYEEKKKLLSIIVTRTVNELKQRSIFKKLKESREFNRGILSSLKSQIAVIDDIGEIIAVNKAWKQFALENGGSTFSKDNKYFNKYNYIDVCKKAALTGDKTADGIVIGLNKIFKKEINNYTIEYPCHSPTEERWFEFIAMPFGKTENKIVITHRNVTERKLSDKKQEQQNVELKKINSELDQFVYSISHDLRAPLTSMLGLIDLSYDCEIQERPELLDMMKQSIEKLDDLITDILIYSRNKNTLAENEEIDFQYLIDSTRNNHLYMSGTENISIDVVINQKSKFISDKIRISYVLNNLYSNAIKYSDSTKDNSFINISIISDNTAAIITFEDNGIGIAEKDKNKIFEMFFRSTTKSTGSGLGLYILKESIDKMNGEINLESELYQGSVFTIVIPNLINQ